MYNALKLLVHSDGEFICKLDSELATSLAFCGITHGGSEAKLRFHTQIVKPFLDLDDI